jgi:transcriptional regulator
MRRLFSLGLTEREKQILRLKKGELSDYEIARKLRVDAANVTRSRKTALRKIELAQADLDFALQVGVKKNSDLMKG